MNNQGPMAGLAGIVFGMLICVIVFILLGYVVRCLFLLTLHKTMNAVAPENRQMAPGLVWLQLIPFFEVVWNVVMVNKITASLEREYESRGWGTGENFGRTTGRIWSWGIVAYCAIVFIQYAALFAVAGGAGPAGPAPELAVPFMVIGLLVWAVLLAVFVCWIIYWVQIAGYGSALRTRGGRRYESDEQEDYADDYDRPQRRRDNDDDYDYDHRSR